MNFRRGSGDEDPGFQMAPMIDIVFLLLVFFLITAALQQVEKEMELALPEADETQVHSQSLSEIIINVKENGDIVIAAKKWEIETLRKRLAKLARIAGDALPSVIIRSDAQARMQNVIDVLDACAKAGMHNVSFVTLDRPSE